MELYGQVIIMASVKLIFVILIYSCIDITHSYGKFTIAHISSHKLGTGLPIEPIPEPGGIGIITTLARCIGDRSMWVQYSERRFCPSESLIVALTTLTGRHGVVLFYAGTTWHVIYVVDHHDGPAVGIVGGRRVHIEMVPYMASVRLNGTYHWCGGSIIHEQFILTAAHCIEPNIQYKILVGTDHVDNGGELHDVSKIIIHEKYSNVTQDYDICIIKLSSPLTLGPKVAKIELPAEKSKVKKGTMLTIAGWGNTKTNGTISETLLEVNIPVVATGTCQKQYFSALRLITARMLCAGGHGKDSCQGDSGGPLTQENVQIGVASFGIGCGELPGIYTKVSALLPWIKETMSQNL